MTTKQMRQEIIDKYTAIPESQVSAGVYIKTVGYKYVTLLNTWDTTTLDRVEIDDFYNDYINN